MDCAALYSEKLNLSYLKLLSYVRLDPKGRF